MSTTTNIFGRCVKLQEKRNWKAKIARISAKNILQRTSELDWTLDNIRKEKISRFFE